MVACTHVIARSNHSVKSPSEFIVHPIAFETAVSEVSFPYGKIIKSLHDKERSLSIERDSLVQRLMRRAILLIESDRRRRSLVWPPTCPSHLVVKYEPSNGKGGESCSAVTD